MLLIDKPAGPTSHDVVALARRVIGERRIGHTGTLDPFATGLLVLLVGRATRLLPYIEGEPKEYLATIRFGAATDTDDVTGVEIAAAEPPGEEAVRRAIHALTGPLEQVPPAFSAKKVGGRRAYRAARGGERPALRPTRVVVHSWDVLAWRGHELDARITCGSGTYVRALARDLGRLAGSAAHLAALRRTRSGPFAVADAASLADLRDGRAPLRPALEALRGLPAERLDDEGVRRVLRGQRVEARVAARRASLVDATGRLIAVGERSGEEWQPRAVVVDA